MTGLDLFATLHLRISRFAGDGRREESIARFPASFIPSSRSVIRGAHGSRPERVAFPESMRSLDGFAEQQDASDIPQIRSVFLRILVEIRTVFFK